MVEFTPVRRNAAIKINRGPNISPLFMSLIRKLFVGDDPAIIFDHDKGIMRCASGVAFLKLPYDEKSLAGTTALPYFTPTDRGHVVFIVALAEDKWLGLEDELAHQMSLTDVHTKTLVMPDDLEAWAAGSYKAALNYYVYSQGSVIANRSLWGELGLDDPKGDALVYEICVPEILRIKFVELFGVALDFETGKAKFLSKFGDLSDFETTSRRIARYDCNSVAPPANLPPVVDGHSVMDALNRHENELKRAGRERLKDAGAFVNRDRTQLITVKIENESPFEELARDAFLEATYDNGTIDCFPSRQLSSNWHKHGICITAKDLNVADFADEDDDDIVVLDVRGIIAEFEEAADLAEAAKHLITSPFAGADDIAEDEPYLIEDYVISHGISVFCGDPDVGKTTLAVDMMVCTAFGSPWQGRETDCRPVVYYALEGDGDVKKRIKAKEHNLKNGIGSSWGEGPAPIIIHTRIPETQDEWRAEIDGLAEKFEKIFLARQATGHDLDHLAHGDAWAWARSIVVVVDTFRAAIGGGDERTVAASTFINRCGDLLEEYSDIGSDGDEFREPYESSVSHVLILHHNQKNAKQFAGGGPIYSNTHGFYYITRAAKQSGKNRAPVFLIVPDRVKGIELPPPVRLKMETVKVPGTSRTTVVVKSASNLKKELQEITEELAKLPDTEEIHPSDLNDILDATKDHDPKSSAERMHRKRSITALLDAGVLEEIQSEAGTSYRLVAEV